MELVSILDVKDVDDVKQVDGSGFHSFREFCNEIYTEHRTIMKSAL
jgi:hypothetical protein